MINRHRKSVPFELHSTFWWNLFILFFLFRNVWRLAFCLSINKIYIASTFHWWWQLLTIKIWEKSKQSIRARLAGLNISDQLIWIYIYIYIEKARMSHFIALGVGLWWNTFKQKILHQIKTNEGINELNAVSRNHHHHHQHQRKKNTFKLWLTKLLVSQYGAEMIAK